MPPRNLFNPTGRRHSPSTGITRGGGASVSMGSTSGGLSGSSASSLLNTFLGLMDRAVNYSREQSLEDNAREFGQNVLKLNEVELERFVHPNNLPYTQQLMNRFLERDETKKIDRKQAELFQRLFPSLQGKPPPKNVPTAQTGITPSANPANPANPLGVIEKIVPPSSTQGNLFRGAEKVYEPDAQFEEDFSEGNLSDVPDAASLPPGAVEITKENIDTLVPENFQEGSQRKKVEDIGTMVSSAAREATKTNQETSLLKATEEVLAGENNITPPPENIAGLNPTQRVEKAIGDKLFFNMFKEDVNKLGLNHPLLQGLVKLNIDQLTDLYGTETGRSIIKSAFTQYFNTLNNNYNTRLKLGAEFQSDTQKAVIARQDFANKIKLQERKEKHDRKMAKYKDRLKTAHEKGKMLLAQNIARDAALEDQKFKREFDVEKRETELQFKKDFLKHELGAKVQSKTENLELFEDKHTTILKDPNTGNLSVMQVGKNTGGISVTEIPGTENLNKLPLPLSLTAGTTPTKSVLSEIQKKVDIAASLATELGELKTYLVSDDGKTALTYFDKSARGMLQKLGSFKFGIMALDALGKNELTRNFTQEQIKELRRFEKFSQNAQNQFIRFRKFITGVAGGEFEMGEIKKAFFNLEEDDWFTLTAKIDGLLELQQRIYTGAVAILKNNTIGGKAQTTQLNQLVEQSLAKSGYTWDTFYVKRKDNSKVMNENLNNLQDLLSQKGVK